MPSTKQFDEKEALRRAIDVFWESGYEGTSMAMLLERMGIQKGSFYATFSSKHDVFMAALANYDQERRQFIHGKIAGLGARKAIETLFELTTKECATKGEGRIRGCLMINAALEMAPLDETIGAFARKSMQGFQALLTDLIKRGQEEGDIAKTVEPKQMGKTLFGQIIAMRVYARAGMPASSVSAIASGVKTMLDSPS